MKRLFVALSLVCCQLSFSMAQDYYYNPVINRSLPDPSVIKAPDGYFYLYATEDTHNVPIYRSKNLVNWRYVATAFTDATRPMDYCPNGGIWAPDINYINGQYVLYYSKSEWGKTWENGIGVAVSSRPDGGFHSAHKLFLSSEIGIENCIDPFFIEDDGHNYLFWGSFHDIYGVELTEDGLAIKEGCTPKKIAGGLIEATMIVKHDGYFYLIGSAGSCCEGANSTYRLVMTRATDIFGPYLDRNGNTAVGDNFTLLLNNSPEVYGPGHCSEFVEDDAGQTWVLYHGFPADNVNLGRVTYLDRIVWKKDGWPSIARSMPSTEAEVPLFGDAAGIDSVSASADDEFLFLPTEAPGMYRIESPDSEPYTWRLVNANGVQKLRGTGTGTIIVDASQMPSGMYVIEVQTKHGHQSKKIVKG